jgi:hypothetical protein
MGAGIDYGMGRTNIDVKTGIRYGVISQHSVGRAWYDDAEADYGTPHCPKCGNDAIAYVGDTDFEEAEEMDTGPGCADFMCLPCKYVFDSQDAYSEEPLGYSYTSDEYELSDCLDSDIIVTRSPYYTLAPYCSPCVPGACSLDSACEDGAKAYCLGHDWFEERKAPYPVYSVETGEQIFPVKYGKAVY